MQGIKQVIKDNPLLVLAAIVLTVASAPKILSGEWQQSVQVSDRLKQQRLAMEQAARSDEIKAEESQRLAEKAATRYQQGCLVPLQRTGKGFSLAPVIEGGQLQVNGKQLMVGTVCDAYGVTGEIQSGVITDLASTPDRKLFAPTLKRYESTSAQQIKYNAPVYKEDR